MLWQGTPIRLCAKFTVNDITTPRFENGRRLAKDPSEHPTSNRQDVNGFPLRLSAKRSNDYPCYCMGSGSENRRIGLPAADGTTVDEVEKRDNMVPDRLAIDRLSSSVAVDRRLKMEENIIIASKINVFTFDRR